MTEIDLTCPHCLGMAEIGDRHKVRIGDARGELVTQYWCRSCTSDTRRCGGCSTRYDEDSASINIIEVSTGRQRSTFCYFEECYIGNVWVCATDGKVNYTGDSFCATCDRDKDGNLQRCRCGNGSSDSPVHTSSCQPNLVFHGIATEIMMGFELEMEFTRGLRDAAQFAREKLQIPEIAQLKNDGSLNNGFELVTQPHTLTAYSEQTTLWDTIRELRDDYGARSWDPKSCGFHIHLGRDGFSNGKHMHRFIEFIYRHPEEMMKFGGRKSTYARFDDVWGFDVYDRPIFSFEMKGGENLNGGEKYTAVNTSKQATIELRFMRGTTKIESIFAYLQMAHAIAEYTRTEAEGWCDWDNFASWVVDHTETYPELLAKLPNIKDVSLEALNALTIDA